MSDFIRLAKSLIKLAEENGASKESIRRILKEETRLFISPLASM
jgi:hypothetical protein